MMFKDILTAYLLAYRYALLLFLKIVILTTIIPYKIYCQKVQNQHILNGCTLYILSGKVYRESAATLYKS